MLKKISIVILLIFHIFPHQFAYAGHKDVQGLKEKFRVIKETLCQKDFDDFYSVKQHIAVMIEIDQEVRNQFLNDMKNPEIIQLLTEIDSFNAAHLKAILDVHQWIAISKFGKEADHQAWLLVQHADHDLAFQQKCLCTLEKLLPLNETNPTNYAYLFDRVAINSGRKQSYGTQVDINEDQLKLLPYEGTLRELNERRHAAGLEPVEKYLETLKRMLIDISPKAV